MLRKGGKIVYSTCSVLPHENQLQVKHACEKYNLSVEDNAMFQTMPKLGGMDGFFSATLIKN